MNIKKRLAIILLVIAILLSLVSIAMMSGDNFTSLKKDKGNLGNSSPDGSLHLFIEDNNVQTGKGSG
jgi:hypothetical protein